MKILTRFIIPIYKDSRKVQINRNYASKWNLYLYVLIQQNLLISGEKMLMSPELKGCVTWFIYVLDLVWARHNCTNCHHCRICLTDFREGGRFWSLPIREQPRKTSSWIGLISYIRRSLKKKILKPHVFLQQQKSCKKGGVRNICGY